MFRGLERREMLFIFARRLISQVEPDALPMHIHSVQSKVQQNPVLVKSIVLMRTIEFTWKAQEEKTHRLSTRV